MGAANDAEVNNKAYRKKLKAASFGITVAYIWGSSRRVVSSCLQARSKRVYKSSGRDIQFCVQGKRDDLDGEAMMTADK